MAASYISELGDKLSHNVANTDGNRVKILAPVYYTDGSNHPSIATALAGKTTKVDGVTGATVNRFGTCGTAAATAAKTVSITTGTFSLEAGAQVMVKFTNANTASTPTLNVGSTGARNIFCNGSQITTGNNKAWLAGTVLFVFDGNQYHLVGAGTGPSGPTGATGPTGPTGPSGPTGPTYFHGTNFWSGNNLAANNLNTTDANLMIQNGHYYWKTSGPAKSEGNSSAEGDGALYVQAYSDTWVAQIAQDYRNGRLFVRGKNNNSWTAWRPVLCTEVNEINTYMMDQSDTSHTQQWFNYRGLPQVNGGVRTYPITDYIFARGTQGSGIAANVVGVTVHAGKFRMSNSATLEYNSTTQSVDFVF